MSLPPKPICEYCQHKFEITGKELEFGFYCSAECKKNYENLGELK